MTMKQKANTIQQIGDEYKDCYVVYTRKSTDDADNQKNSIAYQKLEIDRYNNRELINVAQLNVQGFCNEGIIEEHHSGFKEDSEFETNPDGTISISVDRPKFLILVNLLRQKKIKGVISLCWDRFSRNEADDMLTKKLLKQGVDVRFVQAKYDSSSSGALHMDIDGMFSRHYSRVISEKVRDSYKKLLSEGKCVYSAPIGYLNEGSDSKPYDPVKAPVVKRIFEHYATGEWSFSALAKWAGQNGLISRPIRRKRTKEEKSNGVELEEIPKTIRPITEKTIENILNNPFYVGKLLHKGQLIDSQVHQPLIDFSLFYKVQSMLKARNRTVHYPELAFFTYRGIIKCATCHRVYSPYIQKGIEYYRASCKQGCPNSVRNVNDKFLTEKVVGILDRVHFDDGELAVLETNSRVALDKITEKRNKELADLHRNHCKILDDLDYLAKDKLSLLRTGIYTPHQILEEEGRLTILLAEVKSKIDACSDSAKAMLDYVIAFSELVKNASEYYIYALDTEKRDLAVQVFSELYIESGELKYVAKYGYDALLRRFDPQFSNSGAPHYVLLKLPEITNSIKASLTQLQGFLDNITSSNKQRKAA
jgi:site-specific DNA recombinase